MNHHWSCSAIMQKDFTNQSSLFLRKSLLHDRNSNLEAKPDHLYNTDQQMCLSRLPEFYFVTFWLSCHVNKKLLWDRCVLTLCSVIRMTDQLLAAPGGVSAALSKSRRTSESSRTSSPHVSECGKKKNKVYRYICMCTHLCLSICMFAPSPC